MPIASLAAFWAVSMLFVITPGADWAYTISAGLRRGAVIPAIAGLLLGHLTATLIVAAGVGALVASMPIALSVLTMSGAAYLMWLGLALLRHAAIPSAGEAEPAQTWRGWAFKGFCVSGLNPKVFLLFLALLPQFTSAAAPLPIPAQIIALGAVHILNCGAVYLLVGYSSAAVLSTRPNAARTVSRVSGGAMVGIAVLLFGEQFVR